MSAESKKKKIVVTGAGGNMGRAIVNGLKETGEYEVVACSHNPKEGYDDFLLELSDPESCIQALEGADVVIHMAFWKSPKREFFIPNGVESNIKGMFNLFEAARINGVKRVIFGSSNHVFGFYPVEMDVDDHAAYRPDSIYGLCKCWGELLGRYYSDRFGISSINIRIGHSRGDREIVDIGSRECKQWISNKDLVQLMIKCIEADDSLMYDCFPGISANEDMWSLDRAREILGYHPVDDGHTMITPETKYTETAYKGGQYPTY